MPGHSHSNKKKPFKNLSMFSSFESPFIFPGRRRLRRLPNVPRTQEKLQEFKLILNDPVARLSARCRGQGPDIS